MIKNAIIAAVFAITPMALAEDSSAQCYSRGYAPVYRAPAVSYRSYVPSYRSYRVPSYSSRYGYGVPGSRYGYGRYGYGPSFYGRGTSIGVGRGGISLNFGF